MIEYLVVIAVLAPFVTYYLAHGRTFYAVVAIGIILNALAISAVGFLAILKREPSIGIFKSSRDPELARKLSVEFPTIAQDGLILSLGLLVPYWIFGATMIDLIRGRTTI